MAKVSLWRRLHQQGVEEERQEDSKEGMRRGRGGGVAEVFVAAAQVPGRYFICKE